LSTHFPFFFHFFVDKLRCSIYIFLFGYRPFLPNDLFLDFSTERAVPVPLLFSPARRPTTLKVGFPSGVFFPFFSCSLQLEMFLQSPCPSPRSPVWRSNPILPILFFFFSRLTTVFLFAITFSLIGSFFYPGDPRFDISPPPLYTAFSFFMGTTPPTLRRNLLLLSLIPPPWSSTSTNRALRHLSCALSSFTLTLPGTLDVTFVPLSFCLRWRSELILKGSFVPFSGALGVKLFADLSTVVPSLKRPNVQLASL